MLSLFYQFLVYCRLILAFGLSSVCYYVVLFIVLWRRFICVKTIQISKTDLISQRYQIMIVNMLKNWSRRYSSHYIIKIIGFMQFYYAINLGIVSSCIVFSYLYLEFIDLLQV